MKLTKTQLSNMRESQRVLGLQQVEIIQQDLNSLDSRLRTLSSDADIAAFRDKLVAGVQQLDRTLTRMWALKNVSEMAD